MKKVAVQLLILVLVLASCAQMNSMITGAKLTPEARYYDALSTFNRNVERYNQVYALSPSEVKADWKTNIDPVIRIASEALDVWKTALYSQDKEQAWNDAFGKLITALVSNGIIKIE